jgi:hypothetical protein
VQDGEDDIQGEARERRRRVDAVTGRTLPIDQNQRLLTLVQRHDDVAAVARAQRLVAHLFDHLGGRGGGRRAIGERPAAILLDADRNRLVASPIDVREHRGG